MSSPMHSTMTRHLLPRSTEPRERGLLAAVVAVTVLLVGCTTQPAATPLAATPTPAPASAGVPATTPPATAAPTAAAAFPRNPAPYVEGAPYTQTLDPVAFVDRIENPFLPFKPGAKWVYGGAERIEIEVLEETKDILGIKATVVRDRVFEGDTLIEDTLDWYAQDIDGNVWYLGEKTAEYEDGKVVSTAGSWEAGVDGAVPGIIMLAHPQVGDTYRQEFYKGEAEDVAAVTALSGSISVKAGTWSGSDVLVTEEWTPLEPDVRERKTYARGAGVVEIRTILGGSDVTTLEQVTFGSP